MDLWISGFRNFGISGFLGFWITGFLDYWISRFLDVLIFEFLHYILGFGSLDFRISECLEFAIFIISGYNLHL